MCGLYSNQNEHGALLDISAPKKIVLVLKQAAGE